MESHYFGIIYLGWLPYLLLTIVLYSRWNEKKIFLAPIIAALFQCGGWILHIYDHNRLSGTPDQMYSWIVPGILSIAGWLVIIIGIFKLLSRYNKSKNEPDIRP